MDLRWNRVARVSPDACHRGVLRPAADPHDRHSWTHHGHFPKDFKSGLNLRLRCTAVTHAEKCTLDAQTFDLARSSRPRGNERSTSHLGAEPEPDHREERTSDAGRILQQVTNAAPARIQGCGLAAAPLPLHLKSSILGPVVGVHLWRTIGARTLERNRDGLRCLRDVEPLDAGARAVENVGELYFLPLRTVRFGAPSLGPHCLGVSSVPTQNGRALIFPGVSHLFRDLPPSTPRFNTQNTSSAKVHPASGGFFTVTGLAVILLRSVTYGGRFVHAGTSLYILVGTTSTAAEI